MAIIIIKTVVVVVVVMMAKKKMKKKKKKMKTIRAFCYRNAASTLYGKTHRLFFLWVVIAFSIPSVATKTAQTRSQQQQKQQQKTESLGFSFHLSRDGRRIEKSLSLNDRYDDIGRIPVAMEGSDKAGLVQVVDVMIGTPPRLSRMMLDLQSSVSLIQERILAMSASYVSTASSYSKTTMTPQAFSDFSQMTKTRPRNGTSVWKRVGPIAYGSEVIELAGVSIRVPVTIENDDMKERLESSQIGGGGCSDCVGVLGLGPASPFWLLWPGFTLGPGPLPLLGMEEPTSGLPQALKQSLKNLDAFQLNALGFIPCFDERWTCSLRGRVMGMECIIDLDFKTVETILPMPVYWDYVEKSFEAKEWLDLVIEVFDPLRSSYHAVTVRSSDISIDAWSSRGHSSHAPASGGSSFRAVAPGGSRSVLLIESDGAIDQVFRVKLGSSLFYSLSFDILVGARMARIRQWHSSRNLSWPMLLLVLFLFISILRQPKPKINPYHHATKKGIIRPVFDKARLGMHAIVSRLEKGFGGGGGGGAFPSSHHHLNEYLMMDERDAAISFFETITKRIISMSSRLSVSDFFRRALEACVIIALIGLLVFDGDTHERLAPFGIVYPYVCCAGGVTILFQGLAFFRVCFFDDSIQEKSSAPSSSSSSHKTRTKSKQDASLDRKQQDFLTDQAFDMTLLSERNNAMERSLHQSAAFLALWIIFMQLRQIQLSSFATLVFSTLFCYISCAAVAFAVFMPFVSHEQEAFLKVFGKRNKKERSFKKRLSSLHHHDARPFRFRPLTASALWFSFVIYEIALALVSFLVAGDYVLRPFLEDLFHSGSPLLSGFGAMVFYLGVIAIAFREARRTYRQKRLDQLRDSLCALGVLGHDPNHGKKE